MRKSEEFAKKLRDILSHHGHAAPPAESPAIIIPEQKAPSPPPPSERLLIRRPEPVNLESAVPGAEVPTPAGGRAYVIRRWVSEAPAPLQKISSDLARVVSSEHSALREHLAQAGAIEFPDLEDFLFVDLETTGLGATPLFLIGAMVWEEGGLVVYQYFARNYAEESAAIELFKRLAEGRKLLVSFNGKAFDVPYLKMRSAATAVPLTLDQPHLDLLKVARKEWRKRLPNCKLQTLEYLICGRLRHGDIPGSLIPEAYHEYVRTGDARVMATVMEHNFQDLVTLADLIVQLVEPRL